MLRLLLKDIKDSLVRENFRKLETSINQEAMPKANWKFFEITVSAGVTNLRYPHRMGFMPKDVLTTYVSNEESVIWNYAEFSDEYLDLSTSGACTIRAYVGRHEES